jgi:pilus assembly protein CpaB
MGPVRIIILVVALTAAVGAALVVRGIAKGQAAPVAAGPAPVVERPMTEVLVAKRDLPPGTILTEEDVAWQAWPKESLNEAFITQAGAPKAEGESVVVKKVAEAAEVAKDQLTGPNAPVADLVGAVVREEILAQEPMTKRKLVRAGSAGIMAITLESGMRAMAVPLSPESAAGGFILPGDHVDVVQSREGGSEAGGAKRFASATILRNVKVLAIDQAIGSKDQAVVGATATLELTPRQSEILVLAKTEGQLTLVLRSYADTAGAPETVTSRSGASGAGYQSPVVRVYRNAQATEIAVAR